jgi:hypothetical protein
LVTAIITERGIAYPPYAESLRELKTGQPGDIAGTKTEPSDGTSRDNHSSK